MAAARDAAIAAAVMVIVSLGIDALKPGPMTKSHVAFAFSYGLLISPLFYKTMIERRARAAGHHALEATLPLFEKVMTAWPVVIAIALLAWWFLAVVIAVVWDAVSAG